jgi:phosphoglycerate kinase
MGLDAGPEARKAAAAVIRASKAVLWNGPLGVFEMPSFAKGTEMLATEIAKATREGTFSLVGGGDSVAAVKSLGKASEMSYVSTGGGAMLEFLEGKSLPGIIAIEGKI